MNLQEAEKAVQEAIDNNPATMFKLYEIPEQELFEMCTDLAQRVTLRIVYGMMGDPYDALITTASTAMSLGIAMGREIERAHKDDSNF